MNEEIDFDKEKALTQLINWFDDSGVSFKQSGEFSKQCTEICKILGLKDE